MSIKPTCKEVNRLISERMDRNLSVIERLRLHLHMKICDACSNFNGQIQLIRKAIRQHPLD